MKTPSFRTAFVSNDRLGYNTGWFTKLLFTFDRENQTVFLVKQVVNYLNAAGRAVKACGSKYRIEFLELKQETLTAKLGNPTVYGREDVN